MAQEQGKVRHQNTRKGNKIVMQASCRHISGIFSQNFPDLLKSALPKPSDRVKKHLTNAIKYSILRL
jgi:hypothetical protein